MIIILGLSVVFVIGLVLWKKFGRYGDWWSAIPCLSGMTLVIALLLLVGFRCDAISEIEEFKATAATLEQARQNKDISAIELAAIQRDVIECNQWLASTKYWAKNPWTNWFLPKRVIRMSPIK